jgi:hypothetical protein
MIEARKAHGHAHGDHDKCRRKKKQRRLHYGEPFFLFHVADNQGSRAVALVADFKGPRSESDRSRALALVAANCVTAALYSLRPAVVGCASGSSFVCRSISFTHCRTNWPKNRSRFFASFFHFATSRASIRMFTIFH